MMEDHWVLVADGGDRARDRDAVVAVRALVAGGYRVAVGVSGGVSLAARSRHCGRTVPLPMVRSADYGVAVRDEVRRAGYLTALPTSEAALLALDDGLGHLVDKDRLEESARLAGLSVPCGRVFPSHEELLAAADELEYPVVVKPVVRRYNAYALSSKAELGTRHAAEGSVVVQPFIDEDLWAVSGVARDGEILAAAHERWLRIFPFPCGLASAAETVEPDLDVEEKLVRLLGDYNGIFCAQFAGRHLIDLNLRVHSSHPLAVSAGANLVALYCDTLRGEKVGRLRARPGVRYRWLEGDVRHLAGAVRDGRLGLVRALLLLRPRSGTAHSIESVKDAGPMLARLSYGARQLMGSSASASAGEGGEQTPSFGQ